MRHYLRVNTEMEGENAMAIVWHFGLAAWLNKVSKCEGS